MDDFDPTPEEVFPLETEYGTLTIDDIAALNNTQTEFIAGTFGEARIILLQKYRYVCMHLHVCVCVCVCSDIKRMRTCICETTRHVLTLVCAGMSAKTGTRAQQ
jgi:hypothetical protein